MHRNMKELCRSDYNSPKENAEKLNKLASYMSTFSYVLLP